MSAPYDIDFLKWNYEQCQAGYNYRDQMVNDIFYKMIQSFIFFLSLFTISILVHISDIHVVKIYFALLGIVGFYSLGSLFIILCSLINCKISLRKQSTTLEKCIKSHYGYWECKFDSDSTFDKMISKLGLYTGNNCQPSNLLKVSGSIIKLLMCLVFCVILCIFSSLYEIFRSSKPHNMEVCCHWECIGKRGGFKSEYDEEASVIQATGIFLIIFWVVCCMYVYFHPYIATEYFLPF